MTKPLIRIIVGSTRENRFSEKAAQWIHGRASARDDAVFELLDLRDFPLPFFEEAIPPGAAKDQYDNPDVIRWRDTIKAADGYLLCTPEYNHGFPAVLKNALDYTYYSWSRKPVAFVSWGGQGGTRGVEQLRLVAAELDMAALRWAVHLRDFWGITDPAALDTQANARSADNMLEHLVWWAVALKTAREASPTG